MEMTTSGLSDPVRQRLTAEREDNSNRRIITFAVGGPLRGYYANLWVLDDENDGVDGNGVRVPAENIIRAWANEHFPRDWASTYLVPDGEECIYKYSLKLLCRGRIEYFEGKTFFHEARQ